jgi:hypothetical protein
MKMNIQNIKFLTVEEAQKKTGKSQSTLTRIVNKYKGSNHIIKEGKKYLISSQILSELFTTIHSKTIQNSNLNSNLNSSLEAKNETIEIMKQVINNQANQISELIENSNKLSERIRESHIIIKSLQEQIKLPEKAQTLTVVDIKSTRHTNTPLIMNLYSQGMTYSKIAEQLNNQGLKNQYGKDYTRDAIKTTVNRNK